MRMLLLALMIAAPAAFVAAPAAASKMPAAIYTDPPHDAANPARMEVLHIPSGGVEINGVAYLAAGPGKHPTLVIAHGWPGNEKNLDLAQAVRRAGWNVVTFNYRGSWGSPGAFHFAQVPEDTAAVLAYIRRADVAAKLGVDPARIALAGHSMGGWATAMAAARDPALIGAITISMGNMGLAGTLPRADLVKLTADSSESLAGTSPEIMADELAAGRTAFDARAGATGLARLPLLMLTADDGLASQAEGVVAAVRAAGGKQVTIVHVATDHSWSDRRIALETLVIDWLKRLK
jgi:pimeloyl-ACP methyl ester carboxylesterase